MTTVTAPRTRRVRVALRNDLRLLARHGILTAAAVTAGAWAGLLQLVPAEHRVVAVELIVFTQLGLIGYTVAGALVLLEKAERSALALAVTPLPARERLLARATALTIVALAATTVVVLAVEVGLPAPTFVLGVVGIATIGVLASLAAVAPHTSLAQWALPSVPPLLMIALPLVVYAGVGTPLLWALPTMGPLHLLRGPGSAAAAIGASATTAVWIVLLGALAARRHARWVATADA